MNLLPNGYRELLDSRLCPLALSGREVVATTYPLEFAPQPSQRPSLNSRLGLSCRDRFLADRGVLLRYTGGHGGRQCAFVTSTGGLADPDRCLAACFSDIFRNPLKSFDRASIEGKRDQSVRKLRDAQPL